MLYCPKCKTEYEDSAVECSDCKVPLVGDLSKETFMVPLIKVKKPDLEEVLAYLEYSKIEPIEVEEQDGEVLIIVGQEVHEQAMAFMSVYVHEHMEEDHEDDYYFGDYETHIEEKEDKVTEMKSSVLSFGVLGAGMVIVGLLNYLDIISLKGFNKSLITVVLCLVGLAFVGVAIKTKNDLSKKLDEEDVVANQKEALHEAYRSKYPLTAFYNRNGLDVSEIDEGASFFVMVDLIKQEIQALNMNFDEVTVNTVSEEIYDKIIKEENA